MQKNTRVLRNSKKGILLILVLLFNSCVSYQDKRVKNYIANNIGSDDNVEIGNFKGKFPFSDKKNNDILEGVSFFDRLDSITDFNFIVLLDNGGEIRGNLNLETRLRDNKWLLINRKNKREMEETWGRAPR